MSVFSKLSKKLSSKQQVEPQAPESEPEEEENLTGEEEELVYDEEGYDQHGFDREGYRRSGYNRNGYLRGINDPLDPSVPLEEDIKKYRRANGFNEYEMAIYANFRDLKDNFEANREDSADILYNVYVNDERRFLDLWKWLLTTFASTLGTPADAFRLGSGVVYSLQRRDVPMSEILRILMNNLDITQTLCKDCAAIDARYADILREALLEGEYQYYERVIGLLLLNKNLGKDESLSIDKVLKLVIENLSKTDMNGEIYEEVTKYIRRAKPMMRKVLQHLLEEKMQYYREQKALKKAEEERNAKLEAQRRKLAEELTEQQKEAGSRLTQRQLRAQYHELKAASIANRKANPTWEGGEFADFQQLEGLMVPAPGKESILDSLIPDDKLELFREPFNKQDPMAIAVRDYNGNKIGYISNRSNTLLALLMDNGQKVFGRIFSIGREPESDIVQVCIEIFMEDD